MVLIWFALTLELIQEFPTMISKGHTSKLTLYALANYCKKFCSGISIMCHDGNHSLIQVHVYRAYTVILGLQFLCVTRCTRPDLACLYLIYMCVHANYNTHISLVNKCSSYIADRSCSHMYAYV